MMIYKSPFPDITIPNVTLAQYVLQHAADMRDQPALIDGPSGRTLTYGQLAGASRLIAASLAKRGLGKGDVLAIWAPNIPEYALPFLAVSMLGGINTTLNSLYTPDEAKFQLNDTGAKYLVTIPQFMDRALPAAQGTGVQEIFVFGEAEGATPFASLMQSDGQLPAVDIDPANDLVVLPYSSGTSGRPKGVMLTHRNLIAQMEQALATRVFQGGDTIMGVLPFYHIYGMVLILLLGLRSGGKIVTIPRFDMEMFLGVMEKYGVTIAPLVPPIVLGLAKHPLVDKFNLSQLRTVTSGAAPLGADLEIACMKRLGCTVLQGYGMTEVSAASHINPGDPARIRHGSVGFILPGMEVQVADVESGEPLAQGLPGEICMRGPNRMVGYWNNADATAATIDADGWLHSGDIGYVDEDGYWYVVDRVKELIKYNAYQVAPAELEAVLVTHPMVADCAVIPAPDAEAGEVPKAFVVTKGEVTAEEIMDFVAARVAPFKKIRQVEFIDQIPKSASGKILRRILAQKDRAGA
jgi:acyl-CoA synthetase (AMP-forming)/AMP-acid ligase II